jgi:TIR domain
MELAGLVLTIVGTVATLVGTYVAVRDYLRRRRSGQGQGQEPEPEPEPSRSDPDGDGSGGSYDVFVSYGGGDAAWVRSFAGRLAAQGVRVAYDELLARPGGVRVHTLEGAIRDAAHGLLVFSPDVWDDGWVRREYAVLMQRSIENEAQRFVPVLVGDPDAPLELPGFVEVLYRADFRGADEATYERLCEEIIRVVRGDPG